MTLIEDTPFPVLALRITATSSPPNLSALLSRPKELRRFTASSLGHSPRRTSRSPMRRSAHQWLMRLHDATSSRSAGRSDLTPVPSRPTKGQRVSEALAPPGTERKQAGNLETSVETLDDAGCTDRRNVLIDNAGAACWNGRQTGLKIRCSYGRVGSSPTAATTRREHCMNTL